jgi:hypothetical protein
MGEHNKKATIWRLFWKLPAYPKMAACADIIDASKKIVIIISKQSAFVCAAIFISLLSPRYKFI